MDTNDHGPVCARCTESTASVSDGITLTARPLASLLLTSLTEHATRGGESAPCGGAGRVAVTVSTAGGGLTTPLFHVSIMWT